MSNNQTLFLQHRRSLSRYPLRVVQVLDSRTLQLDHMQSEIEHDTWSHELRGIHQRYPLKDADCYVLLCSLGDHVYRNNISRYGSREYLPLNWITDTLDIK